MLNGAINRITSYLAQRKERLDACQRWRAEQEQVDAETLVRLGEMGFWPMGPLPQNGVSSETTSAAFKPPVGSQPVRQKQGHRLFGVSSTQG